MSYDDRPLAANLRRLRERAGLTVVELARRSGVGRATLTQLEAGGGNPTLETLYALANELEAPLADLITARDGTPPHVVRAGNGPRVAGAAVEAWLLEQARDGGRSVEIYAFTLHGREVQQSAAHAAGTREHLHLHTGKARVGPAEEPVELGPGDYADFAADVPHVYQRIGTGTVAATLVITGPSA